MNIEWIGSKNFSSRNGWLPVGIVDHISSGSLESMDNWFNSPSNKDSSAHFGVGKEGEIHQYVDVMNKAWHCGYVDIPSNPIYDKYGVINPNLLTIGIEHEGQPFEQLTEKQYSASLWLHEKLMKDFAINSTYLIYGHYQFYTQRANCPGPNFPWDKLFNDINAPTIIHSGYKEILQAVTSQYLEWITAIDTMIAMTAADQSLWDIEILKFLPTLIEKIGNTVYTSEMTWQEYVKTTLSEPEEWLKAVNAIVPIMKLDSNLGAIEIFQWLPELIVKVGKRNLK